MIVWICVAIPCDAFCHHKHWLEKNTYDSSLVTMVTVFGEDVLLYMAKTAYSVEKIWKMFTYLSYKQLFSYHLISILYKWD